MKKHQKTLLIFAIVGTLALFALSAVDQFLFDFSKHTPDAAAVNEIAVETPASEDNESKPEAESVATPPADAVNFQIDPAQSEARFSLGEILGGEPVTVVGKTNLVEGELALTPDDPQSAVLGEILIDARGLATDNSFRNRAIQGQILNTEMYPAISFVPEQILPLPTEMSFGQEVALEISGALTIKDVTQTVTFTAQVTPVSETEIAGHAETMLAYADYGITIPSVPRVAEVDEEVLLELDFVALAE